MPLSIPKEENIDMGLAASQVRMLSLTSRKASIERDILQGSHRKIALSREMNNLANEYYDALSAEKLMYLSDTGEYTNISYKYLMGQPGGIENIDVKSDYSLLLLDRDSGEVVLTSAMINCMGFTAAELAQSAENIYLAIARLCGDANIADFDLGGTFTISPNLVKEICAGKYDTFDENDLTRVINNDDYNLCTLEPQEYTVYNTINSTVINEVGSQIGAAQISTFLGNIDNTYNGFENAYETDSLIQLGTATNATEAANRTKVIARNIARIYFGASSYNDLSLKQKTSVAMVMNSFGIETTSQNPNVMNRPSDLLERSSYAYLSDNDIYFDAKLFTNALYTAMQSDYSVSQDTQPVYSYHSNSSNTSQVNAGYWVYEDDHDNDCHYQLNVPLNTLFSLSATENYIVQIYSGTNHTTTTALNNFMGQLSTDSNLSQAVQSYIANTKSDVVSTFAATTESATTDWAFQISYNSTPLPIDMIDYSSGLANDLFNLNEDDYDSSRLKAYQIHTTNGQDWDNYYTYVDLSALLTCYQAMLLGENVGYGYDAQGNFQFLSPVENPDYHEETAPETVDGAYNVMLTSQNLEKLVTMYNTDTETLFGTVTEAVQATTVTSTVSDQHFVPAGENISQWMQNFRDLINDVKFYYPIVTACAKFGYTESYAHNLQDSDYIDKNIQNGIFQLMSFDTDIFSLNSYKDTDFYLLTSEFSKMNDPAQQAVITAWYETEKAEINSKETYWDTLIENLSTELNSITTEIESVQSLIDDAVKKTFDWGKG